MRPLIRRRQRSDITSELPGVIVHTRVALAGVCPLRMTFMRLSREPSYETESQSREVLGVGVVTANPKINRVS